LASRRVLAKGAVKGVVIAADLSAEAPQARRPM
jgi:hypothetical protein